MGRPKFPKQFERLFWARIRAGSGVEDACREAGVSLRWGREVFRMAGGVNLTPVAGPAGRYLSWPEREEIAALDHAGHGVRESPEQIAGRLRIDFPDDPEMRVSPETIYQSLYVQARGGLKRELTGLDSQDGS